MLPTSSSPKVCPFHCLLMAIHATVKRQPGFPPHAESQSLSSLRMNPSYLPQHEEAQKTMSYSLGQTKASLPMLLQGSLGGLGTWEAGPWYQFCVTLCRV